MQIYFPFIIVSSIFGLVSLISKVKAPQSDFVVNVLGICSLFEWVLWVTYLYKLVSFRNQYSQSFATELFLAILCFCVLYMFNVLWIALFKNKISADPQFRSWAGNAENAFVYKIMQVVSLLATFKFFRVIYGRLFRKPYFSAPFASNQAIFKPANIFTVVSYVFGNVPMMISALQVAGKTQKYKNQLFYYALEVVILNVVTFIFGIADTHKDPHYFEASGTGTASNKDLEKVVPIDKMLKLNLDESIRISNGEQTNQGLYRHYGKQYSGTLELNSSKDILRQFRKDSSDNQLSFLDPDNQASAHNPHYLNSQQQMYRTNS